MRICPNCGEEFRGERCPCCGKVFDEEYEMRQVDKAIKEILVKNLSNNTESISNVYEKVVDSILVVNVPNAHGTGWCIDDELIVTNAHVVEKCYNKTNANIICQSKNDTLTAMKIVYFSREEDIAFLKPITEGKLKAVKPLKLCQDAIKIGTSIVTIGHPGDHYVFNPTEGIVKNPNYKIKVNGKVCPMIHTSLNLIGGNSGGPIFNLKGEVVGMSTLAETYLKYKEVYEQVLGGFKKVDILTREEFICNGIGVSIEALNLALEIYNNK